MREVADSKSALDKLRRILQEQWGLKKELRSITTTPLHDATESGDVDKVRQLGKYGVNCTDSIGWTPLHYACAVGSLNMVRMLVSEFKADTSIQDVDGRTALMLAALAGHDKVVLAMLSDHQCPVENQDLLGCSLVDYASGGGCLSLVQELIKKYHVDIHNQMVLVCAARSGQQKMVLALISEFGCDSDLKDCNGWSLLHYACQGGNASLVRTLIRQHNTDVNARNKKKQLPIHIAALNGQKEVVQALIDEFGCDPNMKGGSGWSVLHYACKKGNASLVRTLIQNHNADVHATNTKYNLPIHIAAQNGHEEVVLTLIHEFDCDPNVKGSKGWSVLHYACERGSARLIRTLIQEHNADVHATTNHNDLPIHIAVINGHEEVVLDLIEFGCDPNMKSGSGGWSVFHYACKKGNASFVWTLIQKHNADVYATTSDDFLPIHIAVFNCHEEVVLDLINEFGCDPNMKDSEGWSVLHYACKKGNTSLVRTLIQKHNADVYATTSDDLLPIHIAALHGHEEVVLTLIQEFGCDPSTKGLLQCVCYEGSAGLVQTLIREHNADIYAHFKGISLPIHMAAFNRQEEVVLVLMNEFDCDPNIKGADGRSSLHIACQKCSSDLVQTMICEYYADIYSRDSDDNTPLHIAALHRNEEMVLALINEFGCNPSASNSLGMSLLHIACQRNFVCLAQVLIQNHHADVNAEDSDGNTPVHIAALNHREELVLLLIKKYGCDPNMKGAKGRSLLHIACQEGSCGLIQTLLCEYNADISSKDSDNYTPLHIAVLHGDEEMVLALINEFGCDSSISGFNGMSLLHIACQRNFACLVQVLILNHCANVNAKNCDKDTPLHLAVASGSKEAFLSLAKLNCDPSFKDYDGGSLLHITCRWGIIGLLQILVEDHCLRLTARDNNSYTPLHLAVLEGQKTMVASLIEDFSCDVYVRASFGASLLHLACKAGHADTVTLLLKYMHPLLLDFHGNTPLHVCSESGHSECVKALLHVHAPITIRNINGKTPVDLATSECKTIFEKYIEDNKQYIYDLYDVLQEKAKKRYSNPERITRIFVVGNPGVGKSSLIEALKREDTTRVTESTVPPHTAGIVPSIYHSSICGRVLFYDFAGDPEYYSSHAAILENLASSGKGDNIFIIVFDLRENDDKIESMLNSWLAFIHHQNFSSRKPILIYVGSHADQVSDNDMKDKKFLLEQLKVNFMLDCCQPKSHEISELQSHIYRLTEYSPRYKLSREASILLGLLEKDFSNVMACSVEDFFRHFEVTHVQLPTNLEQLRPFLSELHDLGLLYMIDQKDSLQVVLNSSQLTNKVHQLLFSEDASRMLAKKYKKEASLSIGIITKKVLDEILPEYVTIDCLIQLQYCQEISHEEANAFPPLADSESTDQSFLFFPALCSAIRSDVLPTPPRCSIGWLARCTDPCNYFPPRFLHVLLLRLIFRFTLSVPKCSPDYDYLKRCCKLWKTGVHWMGQEGVECMVELVRDSKDVVVVTKSGEDRAESRIRVLNEIIRCVMEAKADFCHSMTPQCFLLDSTEDSDYLNEDNLFAMSEVEEFLTSPQEGRALLSKTRQREMRSQKLKCLYGLTHWFRFFPLDRVTVLMYLKDVVSELPLLGVELGLRPSVVDEIEEDFPTSCDRRRREVVKRWMSSTHTPPCWWHLTRALRKNGMGALSAEIERDHRDHIQLQEKLLTEANKSCRPDPEFLQSFAAVVGSDWQSLATSLQLGESIEKGKDLSPQDHASRMLQRWASREDATYGQLCTTLKAIPLFQHSK